MPSETGSIPIPLCEPFLGGREREYVDECLRTGWVSSVGRFVNRFEEEFASRLGIQGAVAVSSGTAALHLALLAVGVKPDDEVLVSTLTFIAPANAIRYVGARPIFIDAEPAHWQMDVHLVREFLENDCERREEGLFNRFSGRRVSAILPVHILGHPVDMDALMQVAEAFDLKVVEDSTESLGATVRSRPTGTIGHVGCFSFNGNKLITTGGGGMVVSPDPQVTQYVRYLSTQAKDPGTEYIHREIGFNYRLTNVQAALGCAQLEQLDAFLDKKQEIAERYSEMLQDLPGLLLPSVAPWAQSCFWLFTVRLDPDHAPVTSREMAKILAEENIITRPLWQPLHLSPAHHSLETPRPVAEALFEQALSLPCSVGLPKADTNKVCRAIRGTWLHSSQTQGQAFFSKPKKES